MRIGLPAAAVLVAAAGILFLGDRPPGDLFERSRRRLEAARAARAPEFAPGPFTRAEEAWEAALAAWRLQNDRPAAFRSYDSVAIRLATAEDLAVGAERRSLSTADSLRRAASHLAAEARELRGPLEEAAAFFPQGFIDRRALLDGHTLLSLSESATRREDWWKAARAAASARAVYDSLARVTSELIRPLAKSAAEWRSRRDALLRGRTTPVVVVDKAARRLYLYQTGRVDSFSVELGRGWLGAKRMEGDRATPEGLYRVVRKLDRGQTIYHRALVLDYPNEEDRRRFATESTSGRLPARARIGGNIEVHGGGGRDVDWTDGCVALADPAMESIFARVPVGTPVLIAPLLTGRIPLADSFDHDTDR